MAQSHSRDSRELATLLLSAAVFPLLGEDTGTEIIDAIARSNSTQMAPGQNWYRGTTTE